MQRPAVVDLSGSLVATGPNAMIFSGSQGFEARSRESTAAGWLVAKIAAIRPTVHEIDPPARAISCTPS